MDLPDGQRLILGFVKARGRRLVTKETNRSLSRYIQEISKLSLNLVWQSILAKDENFSYTSKRTKWEEEKL